MLLYRSFVVGLLGAACLLLAQRQRLEVRMLPAPAPHAVVQDAATIVDVSSALSSAQLAQLLHVPMLDAPMPPRGGFLDLSINGRRTLVLVH